MGIRGVGLADGRGEVLEGREDDRIGFQSFFEREGFCSISVVEFTVGAWVCSPAFLLVGHEAGK